MQQTNLQDIPNTESTTQHEDASAGKSRTALQETQVSDETLEATVYDEQTDDRTLDVPVEVGAFTHREVPNPRTTTWKRIWGVGERENMPYIASIISITTATSEHWSVRRSDHLYKQSDAYSFFHKESVDAAQSLLDTKTLMGGLPSREAALSAATDIMLAANTIDPKLPPAMDERLAVAYCREHHPNHELADRTVQNGKLVEERTDLSCDDPIAHRLEVIEDVYDSPVTLADSFVPEDGDDSGESLLSAFSWIESWESRGFDVSVQMPATREIRVTHKETGEKFEIREISDTKRGSVFKLGATLNGEFIEQHARDAMRESFAVALRDLSRLMRAEIGDSRYYHR